MCDDEEEAGKRDLAMLVGVSKRIAAIAEQKTKRTRASEAAGPQESLKEKMVRFLFLSILVFNVQNKQ